MLGTSQSTQMLSGSWAMAWSLDTAGPGEEVGIGVKMKSTQDAVLETWTQILPFLVRPVIQGVAIPGPQPHLSSDNRKFPPCRGFGVC